MDKKRKQISVLIILIILLIAVNYSFIDNYLEEIYSNINKEDFNVKRVIDGDTFIVGENTSVRLFGVNSPERGEEYYTEAKVFLEELVLNKTVFIESFGQDMYYRELGMVFLDTENQGFSVPQTSKKQEVRGGENINVKLVENGFANVYILEDRKYENELRKAWENCISKNINLCEKSVDECAECIKIKSFVGQKVVLENICSFECDLTNWSIKDEGRKKFVFSKTNLEAGEEITITEKNFREKYVWTDTGDTLFLRDDKTKLVLWGRY